MNEITKLEKNKKINQTLDEYFLQLKKNLDDD